MESVDLREFKELQNQVNLMALDAKAQAQKLEELEVKVKQQDFNQAVTNTIASIVFILVALGTIMATAPYDGVQSIGILMTTLTLSSGSITLLAVNPFVQKK